MPADISTNQVCSEPNIWVFDNFLSTQLLDHIDKQFSSGTAAGPRPGGSRSAHSTLECGVELDISPESRELFDTLRSILHIDEVEPCRKLLIYDVTGETQEPHVDHISLDAMPEWQGYQKCQLDLAKQSVSKWQPDQIVPTFTFVVYFNDVGGIHFPKSSLADKTIKCKRGRIVMFQNYLDGERPKHNDKCIHYGIYDEYLPKRILTGGIVANSTPSTHAGTGLPGQGRGWIYSVAKHRTSHHEEPKPPILSTASPADRANKKKVLAAIKEDGKNFQYAVDALKDDAEVVICAVNQEAANLNHASDRLKDDEEVVRRVIKQNGVVGLRYASTRLKNDWDVVQFAVEASRGPAFEHASDNLRSDREMVLFSVAQSGTCLAWAAPQFRNDKEVVVAAINDKNSTSYSGGALSLQYASDEIKSDKEVLMMAAKKDGNCMQFASSEMKNDLELAILAVTTTGTSIEHVSDEMKNNKEVAMAAVTENGSALQYVSADMKNDKDVVLVAVTGNEKNKVYSGKNLKHASIDMQDDDDVVAASIRPVRYSSGQQFASKRAQGRLQTAADACGVDLPTYAREQANAQMVQVSATKDDGETWHIVCTSLAGMEMASFDFITPPSGENAGLAFRKKLASIMHVNGAALKILLPSGQLLRTMDPKLTFYELMGMEVPPHLAAGAAESGAPPSAKAEAKPKPKSKAKAKARSRSASPAPASAQPRRSNSPSALPRRSNSPGRVSNQSGAGSVG